MVTIGLRLSARRRGSVCNLVQPVLRDRPARRAAAAALSLHAVVVGSKRSAAAVRSTEAARTAAYTPNWLDALGQPNVPVMAGRRAAMNWPRALAGGGRLVTCPRWK